MGAVAELYVKIHADTSELAREIKDGLAKTGGVSSSGGGAVSKGTSGLSAGMAVAGGVTVAAALAIIAGIAVKTYKMAKEDSKAFQGLISFVRGSMGTALDLMVVGILSLFKAFSPAIEGVKEALVPLGNILSGVVDLGKTIGTDIYGFIKTVFTSGGVMDAIKMTLERAETIFNDYVSPYLKVLSDFYTSNASGFVTMFADVGKFLLGTQKLVDAVTIGPVFNQLMGIVTGVGNVINAVTSLGGLIGPSKASGLLGGVGEVSGLLADVIGPALGDIAYVLGVGLGTAGALALILSPIVAPILLLGIILDKLGVLDVIAKLMHWLAQKLGKDEPKKSEREKWEEQIMQMGMGDLEMYAKGIGYKGDISQLFAEQMAAGKSTEEIWASLLQFLWSFAQTRKAEEQRNPGGINQSYWGDLYNDITTGSSA